MAVALKLYVKELLHPVHHHQVRREIRIHSSIRHPNIVELYGSFEDDEHYYLVMEYVNKVKRICFIVFLIPNLRSSAHCRLVISAGLIRAYSIAHI